jgi:hypothetical protein
MFDKFYLSEKDFYHSEDSIITTTKKAFRIINQKKI